MRVLIACECSGVVREAFRKKGHDAWSCDVIPSDDDSPYHIQDDVMNHLNDGWDLMIAHPPCTYLCVSGACWLYNKDGSRNEERWTKREEALDFVRELLNAPIEKIALENPISVISSQIRKPDQIVKPYMFGDDSTKKTCLWLKNLSLLESTDEIVPTTHTTKSGKVYDNWWFQTSLISDLTERSKVRSQTFQGIADAMADQWG